MTTVWVVVVITAGFAVAMLGYLAWRDRARRRSLGEDGSGRTAEATATAERHAAERYAVPGTLWDRGKFDGHS